MKQLSYKTVLDVPRGNGSCELEMRVYKSDIAGQDLKPLMAIHGGTWRHRGSSFFGLEAGISQLTERGFIVFVPFYRLVGDSDGNTECNAVSWRELTDDVEDALDWIKENGAALGALNEPVSLYGQSAGAHLSAWLAAYRSNDVRKALLYYPPTDALEFLSGATLVNGPFEEYRRFGLKSLSRLYGAENGSDEVRLDQIDFSAATVETLDQNWSSLIPDTVFNLGQIDPLAPPVYLARCADATLTDLSAISLIAPPSELIACLKQDLSEFLIDNSFAHVLSDEAVPIHVVQGTADSLVPYQLALHLCEAIDNSALPSAVVDPLTSYSCGTASRIQLVKDADHALELGLCFDSLCPAGEFGSVTRDAVVTAINEAYSWLLEEPAVHGPSGVSVLGLPDLNSNGVADVAVFREDSVLAEIRDGQSGALINNIAFLGDGFTPVSAAPLPDSDGNGAAEIAVLATRNSDGRNVVEMRNVTGAQLPRQTWFAANQTAIAVKVIEDDADGNGVPELAVLSTRDSDGKILVEVKNSFGATNSNSLWFMSGNTPVDIEIVADKDVNGVPEVAVLSSRNSDGRMVVELKNAMGATIPSAVWFMPGNTAIDLAAVADKDMNGIPEVAVLSSRNSDSRNVVEIKNAAGATLPTAIWSAAGFTANRVDAVNDADANGVPEVAVLSTRDSDGQILVQIKNALGATNPRTLWYSAGFDARDLAMISDTDGNGSEEALVLMVRDSDGRILVQGRNAAGSPTPKDYWFTP
jgi:acetyl esterase/lipase